MDTIASAESSGGISGFGVAVVFAGGILVWSGVKGVAVSALFKDIIAGKDPAKLPQTTQVTMPGLLSDINPLKLLSSPGGGSVTPTGGNVTGSAAQNKLLGQKLAASFGWSSGTQWTALNNIIMSESGWNQHAANPTSDARGIGQKISGWSANYQENNAAQQILWTYTYIKQRYGDPVTAWQFHLANGWY